MSSLQRICAFRSFCLISLVLLSGNTAFTTAFAQEFKKRVYVTGGIGVTQVEPESSSDALTISDNSDAGGHLGMGLDITRMLSIEAYAASLGEAEAEFLGASAGTVDYTVFGISALGYLLNSRSGFILGDDDKTGLFQREGASMYARVGIGHMQNDSSRVEYRRDYPNHAAFGLGLEYGWSNGFALRTELMSLDTDAKYWNVAVLKRFGSAGALPVAAAALPVVAEQKVSEPVVVKEPEQTVFKPIIPPYVYFAFDESTLTPESTAKLDTFAERVIENDLQMQVEGHTDWLAPETYNMSLSVRRAEAVANYLVSKGVSRDRLTTIGYGETRPISTNDTEQGRELNRRSEIQLQR